MQAGHASYDSTMFDTLPALLLYFGFLALTLMVGSRVIQGPWLFLLRSFFPNWRFYHRVGQQALLQWRVRPQAVPEQGDSKPAQEDWSAWQAALPRAQSCPVPVALPLAAVVGGVGAPSVPASV